MEGAKSKDAVNFLPFEKIVKKAIGLRNSPLAGGDGGATPLLENPAYFGKELMKKAQGL